MNKGKHTPGPWKLASNRIIPGNDKFPADAPSVCEFPLAFASANWEANAALIAAAPEMLAALKRMQKKAIHDCAKGDCEGCQVDAAVWKAEGKS